MMTRAGPMKSFWTQTESQVMRPPFQLFGVVMVLLLVTIFVDLSTSVLGVVALIALIGFYWRNEEFFVKRAKIRNTTSMRALGVRPIVTSYLIFLVVISMQLTLFIWWSLFSGFFKLLVEDRLFFTGYLLTSSVTWSIIVFANQQYHFNLEKYNFDSKYISSEGVVRRFLFGTGIVTVSAVFAVLSAFFSLRLGSLWSMNEAVAVITGLFVGWPVLVVGAGLVNQFFQVVQVIGLCLRGSRRELSEEIGPEVYVVESEEPLAGAVSVGLYSFIAVSTSLVKQLDEKDLEFVLAHEEGHIVHGDALLAVLAGLVSTVMLTGKNAVYALFDFEKRELRADQYALGKTEDIDQAQRALDSMKELDIDATAGTVSSSIPTVVSFRSDSGSEANLFSRVFEYYYGTFAVRLAHPSVEERKNRLEDD
jgi:Zn-dependent protease with chaperone function